MSVFPRLVWILALASIVCWAAVDQPIGWDFHVLQQAMHSVRSGSDPYLDDISAQDAYQHSPAALRGALPFVYVYSPLTLRWMRDLAAVPEQLTKFGYWLLYALMVLAQLIVARRFAMRREKFVADLLLFFPLFFPGLLLFDSVLGGNIAFILFGFIFLAAWQGWTRNRWAWFYAAVLFASCFKLPYLTLLAIPLLSAHRQWLPACATAAAGAGLFAVQLWFWPVSFEHYLLAIDRMFSFNNDFGSGPTGRLGASLAALNLPYTVPCALFYLATSLILFFALYRLSRDYHSGRLTREQWIPLMMLGVLLLNPRLIEYEIFPFTFFMAILTYRLIAAARRPRVALATVLPIWVAANCLAEMSRPFWRNCECVLLLTLFILGYAQLRIIARRNAMAERRPPRSIAVERPARPLAA